MHRRLRRRPARDLRSLQRGHNEDFEWAMRQDELLEERIEALEEIVATRWPRRILVRRRLARDLRDSVAGYAWAGSDFGDRRSQAIGDGWPPR